MVEFRNWGDDLKISETPAFCPICFKLRKNDKDVEKCIKSHKRRGK